MRGSHIMLAAAAVVFGVVGAVDPVTGPVRSAVAAATTLWDNNVSQAVANPYPGSGSILCCSNSQNQNAAFPTATNQIVDDFVVPSGQQWTISEIDAVGTVYAPFAVLPSTYNVYVYANTNGSVGSQLFSQTAITPGNSSTNNASPNLSVTGLILGAGSYWVSVQANGSNFRWYWDDTPLKSNTYSALFQEPGGYDFSGSNPCATWQLRSSCVGDSTKPDQAFTLLGTFGTTSLAPYGNPASGAGIEGVAPSGNGYYLGSFQNADCNTTTQSSADYSGAITWNGMGTGSTAAIILTATSSPCIFDVYGAYAYYSEGQYNPRVTITEASTGAQVTLYSTLTISEGPLTAGSAPAGQTCTLFAGCTFTAARFSDSNQYCLQEQSNVNTQYTATVNFGDGTSAASNASGTGPVQITGGTLCSFTVTATHTYTSPGSQIVTTTICDESTNCVTTTSGGITPSAPTITVTTPPSTTPSGRLSVFTINYQHVTSYPIPSNYTVKLTEYRYRSGLDIANLNYYNTAQNIVLNYCATRNTAFGQCRARVLSFSCTATTATIYLSYQLPNQTTIHYAELYGNSGNQQFFVVTDNGPGGTITTSPPTTPPPGTVHITC